MSAVECRLESITCDDSLKLTSVSSAVNALSLMPVGIASSQELDLTWDPLQTSCGLMAATEKHCSMAPVMQRCHPSSVLDCSTGTFGKILI